MDTFNTISGEPNDECSDALPIVPHTFHYFLPEDTFDWYQFDLNSPGQLIVALTNFQPQQGQIAVYKGEECGTVDLVCRETNNGEICNNGSPGTSKFLDLGQQSAGHYFLLVSNDGPKTTSEPYRLYVGFPEE